MNSKLITFFIVLFGLISCGGGGGGSSSGSETSGRAATLSDVVGVWEWFTDYGSDGVDEIYIHIDEEGNWTVYDYFGDEFDQGSNCYFIVQGDFLIDLNNGNFNHSDYGDATVTISGDTITITSTSGVVTLTRSSLSISDFTPECPTIL